LTEVASPPDVSLGGLATLVKANLAEVSKKTRDYAYKAESYFDELIFFMSAQKGHSLPGASR